MKPAAATLSNILQEPLGEPVDDFEPRVAIEPRRRDSHGLSTVVSDQASAKLLCVDLDVMRYALGDGEPDVVGSKLQRDVVGKRDVHAGDERVAPCRMPWRLKLMARHRRFALQKLRPQRLT